MRATTLFIDSIGHGNCLFQGFCLKQMFLNQIKVFMLKERKWMENSIVIELKSVKININ